MVQALRVEPKIIHNASTYKSPARDQTNHQVFWVLIYTVQLILASL
jgi:hypothetical protein